MCLHFVLYSLAELGGQQPPSAQETNKVTPQRIALCGRQDPSIHAPHDGVEDSHAPLSRHFSLMSKGSSAIGLGKETCRGTGSAKAISSSLNSPLLSRLISSHPANPKNIRYVRLTWRCLGSAADAKHLRGGRFSSQLRMPHLARAPGNSGLCFHYKFAVLLHSM